MKGFFSFVSIALVALLLIVAASYIFTYKDVRAAAEKDLEVRRFSERFNDVRLALNYTLVDAISDSIYYKYGCVADLPLNIPEFESELTSRTPIYLNEFSNAFSDGLAVNASQNIAFACADEIGAPTDLDLGIFGSTLKSNATRQCSGLVDITLSSENMYVAETRNYSFSVDVSNTQKRVGPIIHIFAIQIRGISTNGSRFVSYTLCPS